MREGRKARRKVPFAQEDEADETEKIAKDAEGEGEVLLYVFGDGGQTDKGDEGADAHERDARVEQVGLGAKKGPTAPRRGHIRWTSCASHADLLHLPSAMILNSSSMTSIKVMKNSSATNQSRCADVMGSSIVNTRANRLTLTMAT